MLKENRGVTLVALVITIIVLLILAGVSISLVVGDNGVLNQAVNAADNTNRAAVQTELEMAVTAVVADWSAARYASNTNPGDLDEYMTTARIKANMSDDFESGLTSFTCNANGGSTKTTIDYKGMTYSFIVELTTSGNSAKVSFDEAVEKSST